MRRLGGVVGSINLMNARRVLAMAAPYPASPSDGRIVPADVIAAQARQSGVGAWTGFGALYGPPAVVRAAQRIVREVLKPVAASLSFVTPSRAAQLSRLASSLPWVRGGALARKTRALEAALQLVAGKPGQVALPLAYLKAPVKPDVSGRLDPARDGCGLIWYPPLVPMIPERVRLYATMVERICAENGIDPLITLTTLSDRCFDSSVPLVFNRNQANAAERAHKCYFDLLEAGKERGFLPYRLGLLGMDRLVSQESTFWQVATELKSALDPKGIIAPGRYSLMAPPRQEPMPPQPKTLY
jgi:4-cresol dehydrogenase (hydroxylating)